jgi:hypothetical protein
MSSRENQGASWPVHGAQGDRYERGGEENTATKRGSSKGQHAPENQPRLKCEGTKGKGVSSVGDHGSCRLVLRSGKLLKNLLRR